MGKQIWERGRGRHTQEREAGEEVRRGENTTVGKECTVVWLRLQGGGVRVREGSKPGHQFGSDFITYGTAGKED